MNLQSDSKENCLVMNKSQNLKLDLANISMRRLKPTNSTPLKQRNISICRKAAFAAVAIYLEENDDGQVKLSELVISRDVTLRIK